MKVAQVLLVQFAALALALAQPQAGQPLDQVTSKQFLQQLIQDGVYFFISPKVAEPLLTHRVEPVLPHGDMMPRFSGTVIIAFEIAKDGKVRHAMTVSGPRLLQAPVLTAVKQWTFKPYLLSGKPTIVATSISLTVSNF
jgi:hypothetical protein